MLTTIQKNINITIVSLSIIKDENIIYNIIFKDFIFYIDFKGLNTLNTLIIAKSSRFAATDIKLEITIVKSSLFQIS